METRLDRIIELFLENADKLSKDERETIGHYIRQRVTRVRTGAIDVTALQPKIHIIKVRAKRKRRKVAKPKKDVS